MADEEKQGEAEKEPKKPGFLARLIKGDADKQAAAGSDETELQAERAAHEATKQKLADAEARVAEFEGLESQAEEKLTAKLKAADDAKAEADRAKADAEKAKAKADAEKAKADADAEKAKVPDQVAVGVRDHLASLGVDPEKLPGVSNQQGKTEFDGLKGRERAAAAFGAQFAGKQPGNN